MFKANLAVSGGQVIAPEPLFDVVAFNEAGEPSLPVASKVLLSGAIACARGFNSRTGNLVAVVIPTADNSSALTVEAKLVASGPVAC